MPEVRVDPLTGLRSIVAVHRADRPGAAFEITPEPAPAPADDPFAEGHEDRTPPELHALRPGGGAPDTPGWTVRVVPNRYPLLAWDAEDPPLQVPADLFTALPARGASEVIVNSAQPVRTLAQLPAEQVVAAAGVWRERMRHHTEAGAACVHLVVNEGREAGASLSHTHAQLFALDFVPAAIARERERFGAYAVRTQGQNLLGDLVQEEVRRRDRLVAVDDDAVVFAPYASRSPYQLALAPRRTRRRFEDDGPTGARLLHDVLNRLGRVLGAPPPLNLWVRTAPRGADAFCWRIDVLPRLTRVAGIELGAGLNVCTVAPEHAAAQLRAA